MGTSRDRPGLTVGIDATNLRRGGGLTHIVQLLRAAEPEAHGFRRVIVWGGGQTLSALPERRWLEPISPAELDRGLLRRSLWQRTGLPAAAHEAHCDVLFVPGGSIYTDFSPVVTMSRNMLPFEWRELRRYGPSLMTLKLALLRRIQSQSYRRADGLIFLTDYAKRVVGEVTGPLRAITTTIPHGIDRRFLTPPRPQLSIEDYDPARPYQLLYVSIIDTYKHQWHVVEAVHALRTKGWPLALHLIGPAYPSALRRLEKVLARLDPYREWVNYHGPVPHARLHEIYGLADLGIFASSCENMPNILLETMAAGLPIASSDRGPMPEILGAAGLYFDPEEPTVIAGALEQLIRSPQLRTELADASFARSKTYSWQLCANRTFALLKEVADLHAKRVAPSND